jgi:predicted DNA-binding transcriptional regulator YafY
MAGLLLLLGIDRLTELRVSPGGLEAKLREKKAWALEEVGTLDNPEVAEVARRQILEAESADQVEAATAMAINLNVQRVLERVKEAIRERRRCYVRYKPELEAAVKTYFVAPLDIKPGETEASRTNDYLWAHSYEHDRTVSLRLDRVRGVELSDERFDPQTLMADWEVREPKWNVAREW